MKNTLKKYSYMEFATAGPSSPWHIRELTEQGRKLTGGIDTPSLCGRTYNGWDLSVEMSPHHDSHTCLKCFREYQRRIDREAKERVEDQLHQAGIIEDPDKDGGLLG